MTPSERGRRFAARESLRGLLRRLAPGRPSGPPAAPPSAGDAGTARERDAQGEAAAAAEEFHRLERAFNERARRLGYRSAASLFWYHTVDLGDGLVTPGSYDYRASLPAFHFPEDMAGLTVLDVGPASGFFAFEFERRGADVVSVEVPSVAALDALPGETVGHTLVKFDRLLRSHSAFTDEDVEQLLRPEKLGEFYYRVFDGPFHFCHRILRSKVRRHYATIYDLAPGRLESDGFDLVFVGDVLLHTLDPLRALGAAASVCRGTLVIAQELPAFGDPHPVMLYVGGDAPGADLVSWWWPNRACLEQMLRKVGFTDVRVVGEHTGLQRPVGGAYRRSIIHATRR